MDCIIGRSVAPERMPVRPCSGQDASLISHKGVRAVDNDYNVSNRISGEFVHPISFRFNLSNRMRASKTSMSSMRTCIGLDALGMHYLRAPRYEVFGRPLTHLRGRFWVGKAH